MKKLKKILLIINIITAILLLICFFLRHKSPEQNILFALNPFVYYFFLAINTVFFVLWLLIKRILALISLISILITISNFLTIVPIKSYFNFDKSDTTSFKIMTYNVNIFGLYNWQSKEIKPNILRLIFDENPDILCLQEAFWSGDKNYFVTVDSILLKLRTKNVHKFAIATAVGKQNFGLVIISKYPIINSYSEKFDSCSNGFCFVDIVKDEDTIRIFNLHLLSMHFDENDYTALSKITDKDHRVTDLKNASGLLKKYMTSCITRAKQADIVRKMLDDTTYPIILCGDLNDIPLSYSYNKIRSNLTDAHKKRGRINDHTWIFNNYKLRIDNIFYSDNFKCKNYYILNEPLSDHYAVVSELR